MASRKDDLSAPTALRRIEDAERLKAVEVQTVHLGRQMDKLGDAMLEHTKSSITRQEQIVSMISTLGLDIDTKMEKIHTRHNALVRKFSYLSGGMAVVAAAATQWGSSMARAIVSAFQSGPPGAK
jgi:hypothetical protein